MTLLNSCQVFKELALLLWRLQLIAQLNRFLALQALVERLGIRMATFGLKFPILLNSTILGILDQMWPYIYLDIQLGPVGQEIYSIVEFNNIGNFRPNVAIHIPRRSTRACRARNLFN